MKIENIEYCSLRKAKTKPDFFNVNSFVCKSFRLRDEREMPNDDSGKVILTVDEQGQSTCTKTACFWWDEFYRSSELGD